jgi:hypothetical protein
MVIESNLNLLFIGFTVVGTSELMVVLVFGFAIFGAVKSELAAANKFEFFV